MWRRPFGVRVASRLPPSIQRRTVSALTPSNPAASPTLYSAIAGLSLCTLGRLAPTTRKVHSGRASNGDGGAEYPGCGYAVVWGGGSECSRTSRLLEYLVSF